MHPMPAGWVEQVACAVKPILARAWSGQPAFPPSPAFLGCWLDVVRVCACACVSPPARACVSVEKRPISPERLHTETSVSSASGLKKALISSGPAARASEGRQQCGGECAGRHGTVDLSLRRRLTHARTHR